MKPPSDRTPEANQLVALRKARGFTNGKAAAAHVRSQVSVVGLADSVWAAYESGTRRISDKHREAIEAVFGPLGDRPGPSKAEPGSLEHYQKRRKPPTLGRAGGEAYRASGGFLERHGVSRRPP